MAKKKKALRILYPENQKYACRDCPARCCRTPWGIPVAPEVAHVALQDAELRTRLVGRAPGILAGGTLPMIEHERQLQCVFLDDDLLCGLQKRHDHRSIPRACQAYPFGFMKNEHGEDVALLSQHCPSIRENYGEPLSTLIEEKLEQVGGSRALAPRMGLPSGRTLAVAHYTALAEKWRADFRQRDPLSAVLAAYDSIERLDGALPSGNVTDADALAALSTLDAVDSAEVAPAALPSIVRDAPDSPSVARLVARRRPTFGARLFYAHLLGNLSYPSRVLTEFAAVRPTWGKRIGSWGNKIAWLFQLGSVDLLHAGPRVPVGRIDRVEPFLARPVGEPVRSYLADVVARRQLFVQQTYLTRVAVDLGFMAALVSRFARARAAGKGALQVDASDVQEALGIADLLMAHQAEAAQSTILANLRLQFMSDRAAFRRFLASEAERP